MFINKKSFNRNIFYKKNSNIYKDIKKKSNKFSVFKNIDIKPLKNNFYIKECVFLLNYFYKNLYFCKNFYHHLWWFFNKYNNGNFIFLPNFYALSKIQIIYNFNFKKILYNAANGNCLIFLNANNLKQKNSFLFPSKKIYITSFFVFGFFNRRENFFNRKNFLRYFKFKKNFKVRGVCKNPVDHHNGGSSKTKKPFFNKYFKIAKFSK